MASVPVVLRQLRRARRRTKKPPSIGRFEQYEREYEEILQSVESIGDERIVDEVAEWMLERTNRQQRLPTPEVVRKQSVKILGENGVEIPTDSVLLSEE